MLGLAAIIDQVAEIMVYFRSLDLFVSDYINFSRA